MIHRRRGLVKHIWLCIELNGYGCPQCKVEESEIWYERNMAANQQHILQPSLADIDLRQSGTNLLIGSIAPGTPMGQIYACSRPRQEGMALVKLAQQLRR